MPRNRKPKPRLTDEDVRRIVTLIETWEGSLTWERLVERVELVLRRAYSRQALDAHEEIKATFQARKSHMRMICDSLRAGKAARDEVPPELALALQRAEAAELRVEVLEEQLDRYRVQFAVWLYNARNGGIPEERLNAPLPVAHQEIGALRSSRRGARRG